MSFQFAGNAAIFHQAGGNDRAEVGNRLAAFEAEKAKEGLGCAWLNSIVDRKMFSQHPEWDVVDNVDNHKIVGGPGFFNFKALAPGYNIELASNILAGFDDACVQLAETGFIAEARDPIVIIDVLVKGVRNAEDF